MGLKTRIFLLLNIDVQELHLRISCRDPHHEDEDCADEGHGVSHLPGGGGRSRYSFKKPQFHPYSYIKEVIICIMFNMIMYIVTVHA
jgi:hypothetical protein